MADTYWITFCISQHGNEDWRYQALLAAIRRLTSGNWWTESVNLLLFDSEHGIDDIAAEVAGAIDLESDVALLAGTAANEARAIGAARDRRLYALMPHALPFRFGPAAPSPPAPAASQA